MRRTICTIPSLCRRSKQVPWLRNRGVLERGKPFALAVVTALGLAVTASSSQADAQSILGTAESFGVGGRSPTPARAPFMVTSASHQAALLPIPPEIVGPPGTIHQTDEVAQQAHPIYDRLQCFEEESKAYFYSPRWANVAMEWHRDVSNF